MSTQDFRIDTPGASANLTILRPIHGVPGDSAHRPLPGLPLTPFEELR